MSGKEQSKLDRMTVRHVMTRKPVVVRKETMLADAVALMVDHRIRHVPVVSSTDQVVGMLTDRDVRAAVGNPRTAFEHGANAQRLRNTAVATVMAKPPITIKPDAPIVDAAEQLIELRIGALPVVDGEGRIAGMISYVDVIRALLPPQSGSV